MRLFQKGIRVLLMTLAITMFLSCSKSDDNGGGGGDNGGVLTAKINGENYRSLPDEAEAFFFAFENDGQSLSIAGKDEQGRTIGIGINNFNGVGTYNIFDRNEEVGIGMYLEGEGDYAQGWLMPVEGGDVGKIVVTDYSGGRVKGTFYFSVTNPILNSTKNITNGVFDVNVISN